MKAMQRDISGTSNAGGQACAPERAMSRFAKLFVLFVSLIWLGLWGGNAYALACTSAATGNWSAVATWAAPCNVAGGPVAGDTVTIGSAHTVTVDGTRSCASVTINAPTPNNQTSLLAVGIGSLSVSGSVTINGGTNQRLSGLSISTGTATIGVNLTPSATNALVTFTGNGTLSIGGNFGNGATFTASTGTVNYNGSGAQSVGAYTYNILKVNNNTAGATLTGATTTSTLTIGDGTASSVFNDGGFQLTSIGTLNLTSGTFKLGAATATTFPTFATRNISAGTAVEYAAGVAQTVSNTPAYQNLTLSGAGNKTAAAGLTVSGNFTIAAGTFTAGNFAHSVGGNWSNSGTFTAGTGTVTFNGTAVQTIGGISNTAFNNLTVSNGSGVSLASSPTISATLTLTAGTFAVGANTLTLNGPTIAGTPANLSTTSSSSLVFGGASAGVLVPSSVGALNNLTVNNANGVTLSGSPTVSGTLTLTTGTITTGANTLITSANCPGSVSITSGWVNGNLQLKFPTGAPSCTFPVGDATTYRPIATVFASVTTAGSLIGSQPGAVDHPNIASSGLDPTKDVNRYWTITKPTASTIAYTTYSATFTFVATDYDVGANTANFKVEASLSSGATWTTTTPGTRTATSTQASGISVPSIANTYYDFAVGEPPLVKFYKGVRQLIDLRENY